MALLPAYAVDGGTLPAQMLRMVAYNLSGGANGVATPDDLKVYPLSTPGAGVTVNAGGALMKTRFTGASAQQTYAAMNDSAVTVNVPATDASGGRTDYLILRVNDPDYTGQTPADPLTALYCSFERVGSLSGLAYPYVPLARIDLPASTGAVTAGHITDLRRVALPKRARDIVMTYAESGVFDDLDGTGGGFADWPETAAVDVHIPEWATKAIVRADILEAIHRDGDADGQMVLQWGAQPAYTDARRWDEVWAGSTSRVDHTVVAGINIPEDYRGTSKPLRVRARRLNGSGYLRADGNTQVVYDIEFIEEA